VCVFAGVCVCVCVCVCVQVVYDQCFAFPRMLVFFLLGTFQVGGSAAVWGGVRASRGKQLTLRAPCRLCTGWLDLCCGLDWVDCVPKEQQAAYDMLGMYYASGCITKPCYST